MTPVFVGIFVYNPPKELRHAREGGHPICYQAVTTKWGASLRWHDGSISMENVQGLAEHKTHGGEQALTFAQCRKNRSAGIDSARRQDTITGDGLSPRQAARRPHRAGCGIGAVDRGTDVSP